MQSRGSQSLGYVPNVSASIRSSWNPGDQKRLFLTQAPGRLQSPKEYTEFPCANLQVVAFKDAKIAAFSHLLWLAIFQPYHLPLPFPPPVRNASCLFIQCQPLLYCTSILFKVVYSKIKNVFIIFCVCLFTYQPCVMEKEMATPSSVLAWRTPGTGEPGGLPSVGLTESDTTEATQRQQWQHV